MEDDPNRIYRLDGITHIIGSIHEESYQCITSMRMQHGMFLDDRIIPYLQIVGLTHLARLNDRWFRLDEPLVSAFIERWWPETHTFYMSFGKCTITLQDVVYYFCLSIDGQYVSGCLTDFEQFIDGGQPGCDWFQELCGVLPPAYYIDKFTVKCTWMQETFSHLAHDTDEEIVRRYVRAYTMMLLSTQLFDDKFDTRMHIQWLSYVARLEDIGGYSWGSAALSWLYQCLCRVANKNVVKLAGPLQLLRSWILCHV
ncbi:protein MAIN-LIKE 2-like [Arachis stenosperma]|uniref:protein MAIN-LIKE 2-like n=1 Tax=Arachis stenosperma TaxID=217475 RepID=UPI0025ACD5E1|nr:protein MAIN-LIKE 2-like [Arachis stenosperma]